MPQTVSVTAAWVLTLLVSTEPSAPWRSTYESTAAAMADSANREPLYAGDDGPAKTVAEYVSVSWFESNHNPSAEGDLDPRTKKPTSFCLGQINQSNFEWLHVSRELLLEDVTVCVHAMNVMMRKSHQVCATKFPTDREAWLSWYTGGGPDCTTKSKKSAHRMLKAQWLFNRFPVQ